MNRVEVTGRPRRIPRLLSGPVRQWNAPPALHERNLRNEGSGKRIGYDKSVSANPLEIRLFGPPQISVFGVVDAYYGPPQTIPLLAYLILQKGKPVARERLASLLWPDEAPESGLANLRRHLHHLQRLLPAPRRFGWLHVTKKTIAWNVGAPAWIDVLEFERMIVDSSTQASAVALYRGEFLDGYFTEWNLGAALHYREKAADALVLISSEMRVRRKYVESRDYAARALVLDEFNERALRELMLTHYVSGNRSAALASYQVFNTRMREELQSEPTSETATLRDLIASTTLPNAPSMNAQRSSSAPLSKAPLVGRQSELDKLRSAWQISRTGAGSIVLIAGEPGIGKSRLCTEFTAGIEPEDGRVIVGWTSNPEEYPYEALVDAARNGLEFASITERDEAWLGELTALLPEILMLQPDSTKRPRLGNLLAMRKSLILLLERVASSKPLVLLIEDLHWAESDTLAAFEALCEQVRALPVLVVATLRNDSRNIQLSALRQRLERKNNVLEIELQGLSLADVTTMVTAASPASPLPVTLPSSIFRASSGNPLFASQLLEGYLEGQDAPLLDTADSLPDTIAGRIRKLPSQSQFVLGIAATINDVFSADIIADVCGWSEADVKQSLEILAERAFICHVGAPGHQYRFMHDVIAIIAYDETALQLRPERHLRVAIVLEKLIGDDPRRFARLARHWALARNRKQASRAFCRAAAHSISVHAKTDALRLGREALALSDTPAERFEALRLICIAQDRHASVDVWKEDLRQLSALALELGADERFVSWELEDSYLSQIGDYDGQRARIREMLSSVTDVGSQAQQIKLLSRLGLLELNTGRFVAALEVLERANGIAVAAKDWLSVARVTHRRVHALARLGRAREARQIIEERAIATKVSSDMTERLEHVFAEATVISIVDEWGSSGHEGTAMIDLARYYGDIKSEAKRVGNEMIDLARYFGDVETEAKAYHLLAVHARHHGDLGGVRECYRRSAELFESIGQTKTTNYLATLWDCAVVDVELGRFDDAVDVCLRMRGQLRNAPALEAMSLACLSDALRGNGRVLEAYDVAVSACALAAELDSPNIKGSATMALGSCERALGMVKEGLVHMREAVAHQRKGGVSPGLLIGLAVLLESLLRTGASPEARSVATEVQTLWETREDLRLRQPAFICSVLARYYASQEQAAEARRCFVRGWEIVEIALSTMDDPANIARYKALPYHRVLEDGFRAITESP